MRRTRPLAFHAYTWYITAPMGRISHIVKAMFVDAGLMKEQCWATCLPACIRTRAAEWNYKLQAQVQNRAREIWTTSN